MLCNELLDRWLQLFVRYSTCDLVDAVAATKPHLNRLSRRGFTIQSGERKKKERKKTGRRRERERRKGKDRARERRKEERERKIERKGEERKKRKRPLSRRKTSILSKDLLTAMAALADVERKKIEKELWTAI